MFGHRNQERRCAVPLLPACITRDVLMILICSQQLAAMRA
jgi:hypothetical protein